MNQRAIQILVGVLASLALGAVVYQAQKGAPSPSDPTQTHDDPQFLPSTKTDAGAGARPMLEVGKDPVQVKQTVSQDEPKTADGVPEDDHIIDAPPPFRISDEVFLPSTKAGPLLLPVLIEEKGEQE